MADNNAIKNDNVETVQDPEQVQEQEKMFTQADIDAAVEKRLARERKKTAEKYADYDEIKSKLNEASKTDSERIAELEKVTSELAKLKKQIEEKEAAEEYQKMVNKVAIENNIDNKYVSLLTGKTEEELVAQAKLLGERFAEPSKKEGQKQVDVKGKSDPYQEVISTIFG